MKTSIEIEKQLDEVRSTNARERECLRIKHDKEEEVLSMEWKEVMIREGKAFCCTTCGVWELTKWQSTLNHGNMCDTCRLHAFIQDANVDVKKRWIGSSIVDVEFYSMNGDAETVWILFPDGEIKKIFVDKPGDIGE